MNIVVVTREEFPFGGAATNRMLSYLPGIAAKGHSVVVLCLFLSQKSNGELLDDLGECDYQGIKIKYTSGNKCWPVGTKKLISKVLLYFKARLNSVYYLWKHRKIVDIVQIYSSDISLYYLFGRVCRFLGINYLIERSELPAIVKQRDKYVNSFMGRQYIRRSEKAYRLFDGWILETQNLVNYYSNFFSQKAKYVVVPMTVEVERFSIAKQLDQCYGDYIAYCGNMAEIDGVSILIKAFSIIHKKYPTTKLLLAGDSDDVPKQKTLAESLGVENEVVFLGRLSRDEVPQFLANAKILALASPTSERASATMPCKVGEYLCTGNPVVVTGLGEINKYLKDGESAYLSAPDSAECFAQKLEECLSDSIKSNTIGQNGKKVAIQNFEASVQVQRIESFYVDFLS